MTIPTNQDRIHHTLCQALAGNPERVDWPAFSPDDWQLLAGTARTHGVAPLLYHTLNEAGVLNSAPNEYSYILRYSYYASAAYNMVIYNELSHILAAFATDSPQPPFMLSPSQSAFPVIVLKGAALAGTVYPDAALRPMSDLDLLVPQDRLGEAMESLQALGYVLEREHFDFGEARLTAYEVNLDGGEHFPVHVELHWSLMGGTESRYRPDIGWFWDHVETADLLDTEALILDPTAHLLYLAAHLALKHGETRSLLRWYYDIHLLITKERARLDWNELVLRAQQFRWTPALHAALHGARDRFDTPLPAGLLETIAQYPDIQAHRSVTRRSGPRALRGWDNLISHGWRGRFHLMRNLICPSPSSIRRRYDPQPAWLWPLYYPYRWFDFLRDGLFVLWQVAKRRW